MKFTLFKLQARTKRLFYSYGKDWLLVLIIGVAFSIIDTLEPFKREFSVVDKTIQHPFAVKETVPVWMLLIIAGIIPIASVLAISLYRRSYTDCHNGLLAFFLTQVLVLIVTDSIKISVGRPRPDLLDRCLDLYANAAAGTPVGPLSDPVNMLSNYTICTRTDLLKDGFKSFPSGHSSFSFGGLGFLSLYLAGKIHLFDERGYIYKSLIVLAPLIAAALVATSRVDDYRHHWQDVTVGALIGLLFATFSYRQYFPSLVSIHCDLPYEPRALTSLLPVSIHNDSSHRHVRVETSENSETSSVHGPQVAVRPPGNEIGDATLARDESFGTVTGGGYQLQKPAGSSSGSYTSVPAH